MQGGGAQRAVLGSLSVPALVFPGSDAGFRHLGRLVRVSGFGSRAGGGAGQPRDCIRPRNWTRRPGMRTGRTLPRRRDEARGNPSTLAGAGHAEKRAAPRHAPPPTPHTHTETPAGPHTGARARPRGGPRGAAGAGAARQPARRTLSCSTDARLLGSATKASRGAAVVEITSGSEPPPRCAMARGGRAGAEGRRCGDFTCTSYDKQSRCAVRQLAAPARGAATTTPSGAAPLVRAAVGRYVPPGPPAALAPARAATPGAPHLESARLHVGSRSLAKGRGAFGEKGCQRAALFALLGTKLAHRARVRTIKHRPER